jgi:hypothetical protein
MTNTPTTRPVITRPTSQQYQPHHSTTDQHSNQPRPTTNYETAHLCITIQRACKADKPGHRELILLVTRFDLERKPDQC